MFALPPRLHKLAPFTRILLKQNYSRPNIMAHSPCSGKIKYWKKWHIKAYNANSYKHMQYPATAADLHKYTSAYIRTYARICTLIVFKNLNLCDERLNKIQILAQSVGFSARHIELYDSIYSPFFSYLSFI